MRPIMQLGTALIDLKTCNCLFGALSLRITKLHISIHSMAPKTAAQRGFWHMIWIHYECKSVSYGAWEIWEASSILSNGCTVGFVIYPFSMKLSCINILLTGEAAAGVSHGNTGIFFVCCNILYTCYKTRSNASLCTYCMRVKAPFQEGYSLLPVITLPNIFPLSSLSFFFSPSHHSFFSVSSATWSQQRARQNMFR